MSEEEKSTKPPLSFRPDPNLPEIYANYSHVTWTLFDIRLRLGQIVPVSNTPGDQAAGFVAQEVGAVTISWGQAKIIRDSLIDVIQRYEKANGEIKLPKLPE